MKRAALILALLWMALRDRWHMSPWNPWGAESPRSRHRAAANVAQILTENRAAFLRTVMGTDETDHKPPNRPIQ